MPNLKSFAFGLYIESTRLSHRRRRRRRRRRCARAAAAVGVGGGCVTPPPPPTSASAEAAAPAATAVGVGGGGSTDVGGATLPPGPESGHCLALADVCPVAPPHYAEHLTPLQSNTCVLPHFNCNFAAGWSTQFHLKGIYQVYTRYIWNPDTLISHHIPTYDVI